MADSIAERPPILAAAHSARTTELLITSLKNRAPAKDARRGIAPRRGET